MDSDLSATPSSETLSSFVKKVRREYSTLSQQDRKEFSEAVLDILDSVWTSVSIETYVSVIRDGVVSGGSVINLAIQVGQMDSLIPVMKFQGDSVDFYIQSLFDRGEKFHLYISSWQKWQDSLTVRFGGGKFSSCAGFILISCCG